MLTSIGGHGFCFVHGAVVDVDSTLAESWVNAGFAVYTTGPATIETADVKHVGAERAVSNRPRRPKAGV